MISSMNERLTTPAPSNAFIRHGTWEQRRVWEVELKVVQERLQGTYDPGEPGNLAKARDLITAGLYFKGLGYPDRSVASLRAARDLAPNVSEFQSFYRDLHEDAGSDMATLWDEEQAVAPYDDVEELKSLAGLPFDEFFQRSRRGVNRRRMCEAIRSVARPGERILEAGCAAGGFYASLLPFIDTSRYTAIDITPRMASRAKHHFPQLDVLRMDVRELAFADDSYPLVFSTDVLMHLVDWRRGLEELYRVTSRMLLLRIRIHTILGARSLVARVGARDASFPYVIHHIAEFCEVLNDLNPLPVDVALTRPKREPMYYHLWQIAVEHPHLMAELEKQKVPAVNASLDLYITKRYD